MIIVGSIVRVYSYVNLYIEGLLMSGVWTCFTFVFFKDSGYFETSVPVNLLKEHYFALPLRAVSYLALLVLMMITKFLEGQMGT